MKKYDTSIIGYISNHSQNVFAGKIIFMTRKQPAIIPVNFKKIDFLAF